ncbi:MULTISPECIES: M20 family metallopeptidase [Streptomyces violaceusniger group]|uniref:Peptidase M20 dimerisation domain-containing protein n=2 Tax=Streptomyces rhizosphaericus TaxID=114699 RepID=A0ABN1SRX5_9ACTN|nr:MULTISPECIES: M20/M25/M40 family metallo-hydrolase [Streptomyces violaceusniger group]
MVPDQDRKQFIAERRDGRIIGRGTADMKGGIVSMLYGAAAAKELGLLGDGRVVLHLVCDEETGSVAGSGHLRQAGLIDERAVAMVTGEPSGGGIWHAARGAVSLRVDLKGCEAHVGQANKGINAFQHMLHVARPVEAYAEEMAARHTRFPMNGDDALGTMLVVGGLSGGGSNFNVIPASVYFTVDGRYNPEEDLDIRWYAQLGIPAFGYGAGRLDVSHGPNEYVDESAIRRAAAVYALYAQEMLA